MDVQKFLKDFMEITWGVWRGGCNAYMKMEILFSPVSTHVYKARVQAMLFHSIPNRGAGFMSNVFALLKNFSIFEEILVVVLK